MRNIARFKESSFIMIKRSIHQADISMLNVYILNNTAKTYIKQKMSELKRVIDKSITKVENFHTSLNS